MSEWRGLDPGGTEQLWDPDILITVLQIFKANEPFSRGDRTSSLFLDLEDSLPEITWRGSDADGAFRPVFRKTNPWVRLGLIGPGTINEFVTPLGEELLAGETSISTVFIEALKDYSEPDGTRSFSIMCSAALQLPSEIFSSNDVEFAVSKDFAQGLVALPEALSKSRERILAFQRSSRRPRTLRSFMSALVSAGALQSNYSGWSLGSEKIAREIARHSRDATKFKVHNSDRGLSASEVAPLYSSFKEVSAGARPVPVFEINVMGKFDPTRRALLLERANSIHESLVEECASIIRSLGMRPVEDVNSFDLAVVECGLIMEMKSINSINCISQLRKAIAQLPEYRWRHQSIFDRHASLAIILDQNLFDFLEVGYIDFIELDRGVKVFWKSERGFVGRDGGLLRDFIQRLRGAN